MPVPKNCLPQSFHAKSVVVFLTLKRKITTYTPEAFLYNHSSTMSTDHI